MIDKFAFDALRAGRPVVHPIPSNSVEQRDLDDLLHVLRLEGYDVSVKYHETGIDWRYWISAKMARRAPGPDAT